MTEAPERIWAWDESGETCLLMGRNEGEWTTEPTKEGWATEYIRADLVDPAAIREAALREALEALRGAGSFGRTAVEKHSALEQYCLCRDATLALIEKEKTE